MDFLSDWKFWLFVATIASGIINWLANQKVMNNHLFHIDEKIDTLTEKVDCVDKKVGNMKADISVLQERTKNI